MKQNYSWQGEPVKAEFGHNMVKSNTAHPLFWYNYECSIERESFALIPSIKITQGDQVWCIANHYGIGINKLIKGGWPNQTHFSLPIEGFEKNNTHAFAIKEFDELQYSKHEAARRLWQKNNFPEEFKRMQSLEKIIRK